MKSIFRIILALIRLFTFLIIGIMLLLFDLFILLIFYPVGKKTCRKVSTFFGPMWGTIFTKILGFRITINGKEHLRKNQNYCIISNHMSYLDILVYGSCLPVLFVSRHDVKYWPLLGTIAWVRGSIFVDRSITGSSERPYVKQIVDYLRMGFNVLVFPEGTTSNGEAVMPFKKTIFACPVRAELPILPVTIKYTRINHEPFSASNRDQICWYGEMTFPDHFWNVLKVWRIDATLTIHPPVFEKAEEDWREQNRTLSVKIHNIIEEGYLNKSTN